jgi:hypothetical protein
MTLQKNTPRLWTIASGIAMIVTDLHGDWDAYQRHRDRFVTLHAQGKADYLILMGDLIHRKNGPDHSLDIVLDVLALQATFGDTLITLCGNHELPHIYSLMTELTTLYSFEHDLTAGGHYETIINFFHSLPFFLRTPAGVSLTHAGASPPMTLPHTAHKLFAWNHQAYLDWAEQRIQQTDNIAEYQQRYAEANSFDSYADMVSNYFGAEIAADDPRFNYLLRGSIASQHPDFHLLWEALFTRCEETIGTTAYNNMVQSMINQLSDNFYQQRLLVAGHMNVSDGYALIGDHHFRLASAKNASPREAGKYLLFDVEQPIREMNDLEQRLSSVYT